MRMPRSVPSRGFCRARASGRSLGFTGIPATWGALPVHFAISASGNSQHPVAGPSPSDPGRNNRPENDKPRGAPIAKVSTYRELRESRNFRTVPAGPHGGSIRTLQLLKDPKPRVEAVKTVEQVVEDAAQGFRRRNRRGCRLPAKTFFGPGRSVHRESAVRSPRAGRGGPRRGSRGGARRPAA